MPAAVILALLSDVHSNLEALRACLAHARDQGAQRYAFLGDLVGYGADPGPVLDITADYAAKGAIVIKGNHDEAACGTHSYLNAAAAAAIKWTASVITPGQREFMERLPMCVRETDVCFVHASALHPERWDYIDSPVAAYRSVQAADRPFTFSGHVHEQMLYVWGPGRMIPFRPRAGLAIPMRAHRRWLAIAGSVGQPRDGNPAAAYAIADLASQTLTFHRIPYDNVAAARKVREAGLPESLAYRLERGI